MLTDSQLRIAEKILRTVNESGNVYNGSSFDSLFTQNITESEEKLKVINEVSFVTACLQKDFKLIRRVIGDLAGMSSPFIGLTQEGSKALKKGLRKYLSEQEKVLNRKEIMEDISLWTSFVAVAISVLTFILK